MEKRIFSASEERTLTDAQKEYLAAHPYIVSLQPHSMLLPSEQLYKTLRHGSTTIDRAMELDALGDWLLGKQAQDTVRTRSYDNYTDAEDLFVDRHGMSSGVS